MRDILELPEEVNVTLDEIMEAYDDCNRHKKNSPSFLKYSKNGYQNLLALFSKLNNGTYHVGASDMFVINSNGKLREIFAANYDDRIVQHLVINKFKHLFYKIFSSRTFSCIDSRGTGMAVDQCRKDYEDMIHRFGGNFYVGTLDIQSFFPSINRHLMWKDIYSKIITIESEQNEWYIKLMKDIMLKDPREGAIRKQPYSAWINLPRNKQAQFIDKTCYVPVGNITSQFFANLFLSDVDYILDGEHLELTKQYSQLLYDALIYNELKYGRYVDDMYILTSSSKIFHECVRCISDILKTKQLKLHPNKIKLNKAKQGVKFVGFWLSGDSEDHFRVTRKRNIIGKFKKQCNKIISSLDMTFTLEDLKYAQSSLNSILGCLKGTNSYKIRKKLLTSDFIKPLLLFFYINKDYDKLNIFEDFYVLSDEYHSNVKQFMSAEQRKKYDMSSYHILSPLEDVSFDNI